MLICCSVIINVENLKTVLCCLIFLWKSDAQKEHHLFEMEIFCNITNVFGEPFIILAE